MSSGLQRRPIAAVADLFLTSPSEGPTGDPRPADAAASSSAEASGARAEIHSERMVPVSLVLASALSDDASAAVNEYARHLAGRGRCVSVLSLSSARRALRVFEPLSARIVQPVQVAPPWPTPDEPAGEAAVTELPRELERDDLDRVLERSDHLLVAWLGRPDLVPRDLRSAAVVVTVLAGTDERQLVEAYRNVKLAANQWPDAQLGVFVSGASDARDARRAGNRLTSLVTGFLGRPVRFEGFTTRQVPITQRFIAERPADRRHPEPDRRWLTHVADFLDHHAERDAAAASWIGTPPDSDTPGNSEPRTGPGVIPDTSEALPLAEPLHNAEQLDACLHGHLPLWRQHAGPTDRLEHDGSDGIVVRRLTRPSDAATIVACALDAKLPVLEAALRAAQAIPNVTEVVLVTPQNDRPLAVGLLSCAVETLHFRQIRLAGRYGLLLSSASAPGAPPRMRT